MKNFILPIVLAFIAGLVLCGCRDTDNDQTFGHMDGPRITIRTIWIDDVSYEPADTIEIDQAGDVKIDYVVESEGDLLLVNNYYVSGTSGTQLPSSVSREQLVEQDALHRYEGQLQCNGFLPFRCAFRVVAANRYGGTDSKKGFYLKLPANSLRDYPGTPVTKDHNGRNFGPSQTNSAPNNSSGLGQTFNNVKSNGRYGHRDMATSQDRAASLDLGINFVNVTEDDREVRKVVMFSPSAFNDVYPQSKPPVNMMPGGAAIPDTDPGYVINYGTGVTYDDLTVTKFYKLDLFTSSMWTDLTSGPRLDALAASFKNLCQDEIVYPDAIGWYFFSSKSSLYEWYGVIYIENLAYSNSGGVPTSVRLSIRTFQYW